AFLCVASLGVLELIQRPENRQPTVRIGRIETSQVSGVDHQDRMKLETDRTRLNVAHSSQEQGAQHLPICRASPNPGGKFLEHPFAGRLFEQPDQGFDFGKEADLASAKLGLLSGKRRKAKAKLAKAQSRAGSGSRFQEMTS